MFRKLCWSSVSLHVHLQLVSAQRCCFVLVSRLLPLFHTCPPALLHLNPPIASVLPLTLCCHTHRPKVTTPGSLRDVTVSDLSDVQRMYLLLEPHSPPGGKCRLMVVGKKRLPDTSKHERFFAFIGERASIGGFVLVLSSCISIDRCAGWQL